MTVSEIIALVTLIILGGSVIVGAIMWIGALHMRLRHAEERIVDLKDWAEKTEKTLTPLASLPAVLKGLGDQIEHGLEMMGLEFRTMNQKLNEHTEQDESRFDELDERQENLSRQMGHVITGGADRIIEIRRGEDEVRSTRRKRKNEPL